ncbi:type II secretion system protein [Sedimentisphaera salicampi]|uniref:Type II secretion system protein G n=1 Tax=Sedimentisphaera salicampi TaxID=1941349 RepID=A0A1W6LK72_9BACT|nr:type II secretion system protein [Sedimentisphaera salicampi]ARN56177.1 type II secretion system protein G [Sedimentisphaera salicampi]
MKKKLNRHGFTLIELLVVISIIALLMAVLMPALSKAREQAKLVVCGNNQHQMILGIQSYQSDNGGKLPPCTQGRANGSFTVPCHLNYHTGNFSGSQPMNGGSVGSYLAKYLPNSEVFNCPLSKWDNKMMCYDTVNGGKATVDELYRNGSNYWLKCSYFLLWNYGGFDFTGRENVHGYKPFKGPGYKNSDHTLLTSDVLFYNDVNFGPRKWLSSHPADGFAQPPERSPVPQDDSPHPYYQKESPDGQDVPEVTMNAGYLDGSVQRYKIGPESATHGSSNTKYYIPLKYK